MSIEVRSKETGEVTGGAVLTMDLDGTKLSACHPTPDPLVAPLDRDRLPARFFLFVRLPDMVLKSTAAVADGSTKIQRYELKLGNRPSRDRLRRKTPITIPAWRPPPDARQPNGQKLDTGDGSFTAPPVRIGNRFWLIHTVNDGGFAHPRVYELSTTANTPLAVYQLSSVPEQNDHLFNVSIAVNGAGANGIAFVNATRTIPTGGKDGRPAMMVLSGPHASATGWESVVVKNSPAQFSHTGTSDTCNTSLAGTCRWDPLSSIQIDPLNKNRAWAINRLVTDGTIAGAGSHWNWRTMIGGVRRRP